MSSRIRPLDPIVINKIAAGEVIERPASVVKELLENSIDALATRIEIELEDGGSELIRLSDDGEGIVSEDLPLAVTSHATSKISTAEDLFRVQSMGFRGEALASIASISKFRIRSRTADAEHGSELEVDGGVLSRVQTCGIPLGTQMEVRQLFFNTPVRRKFLKSTSTELGHITEQFSRIAVAHPRLHLVLRHNGKLLYDLPPSDNLLDRLKLFFGKELSSKLLPIDARHGDLHLWGFVAHPSESRSSRRGQFLFLNGRWIQDRSLQHALTEAYRGLLMVGRHPVVFLFLEMPPDLVDVNVHPTKAEVRFLDSQPLYRLLLSALRNKFLESDLTGTMKTPAGAKPGSGLGMASGLTLTATPGLPVTLRNSDASPLAPTLPGTPPLERQQALQRELAEWATSQLESWSPDAPPKLEHVADRDVDFSIDNVSDESLGVVPAEAEERAVAIESQDTSVGPLRSPPLEPTRSVETSTPSSLHTSTLETETAQDRAIPVAGHAQSRAEIPASSVVRPHPARPRPIQIHDCYIAYESDQGLTVMDQHALHERVMYEQIKRRILGGGIESQRLLTPIPVELSAVQGAVLVEHREMLRQLGLGIEEFGRGTVLIDAVPPMLARSNPVELVRDLADRLLETGKLPTRHDILDGLMAMMSCKAAVKAGQKLTVEEMESLLEQARGTEDSHHCPHGRPTTLTLTRDMLDRQFGRLG